MLNILKDSVFMPLKCTKLLNDGFITNLLLNMKVNEL